MSEQQPVRATLSRKAALSLVLAILSICLWGLTATPALPVGIACLALAVLGLRDIRRGQGRLAGRRLAVWSIVLEVGAMVVVLLLLPFVQRTREAAQRMQST